ncbi:MAG: class I SAM-dependent methyltransferase [Pirellulales bacterium]|nr:class I SAM-dependent methyltransferase [Pirellulales bacterium]
MDVVHGNLYDYPKYYDLLFGADWRAEFDFLRGCFDRHARRPVRRLFEPACGTGRLLIKLAQAGYDVAGNDLNPRAVAFCNARLARHGFPAAAVVGDMANFRLARKADAAFNTINSFRHLPTEEAAEGHLRSMTAALGEGGLYIMGLHLTPKGPPTCDEETWNARRGHLAVHSRMWSIDLDRRHRQETVGMTLDIRTPSRQFRLVDQILFRTYTADQIRDLFRRVDEFELAETYDFGYDLDAPAPVTGRTEDVIFVLRRK